MNKGEFIHRVQALAGIAERDRAERATGAVLSTLCGRITRDEARDLAAQLPNGIDSLCTGSVLKEIMARVSGPNRLDGEAFIAKVAQEGKLDTIQEAQQVTTAVFKTIKEQVTKGEVDDVTDQLPRQLKVMWLES